MKIAFLMEIAKRFSLLSSMLVAGVLLQPLAVAADERPNVIILYADDAGYADFGFQTHTDPAMRNLTPHIDSIARSGARCTNAYMSGAVCSPSRAGMLTGRYQERFGHELNIPPGYMKGGMSLEEKTIADRMKRIGYRTGIIGKWHLGYPRPYQPNRRGFDFFYGLLQGSRPYFPMKKVTPHRVIQRNGKPLPEVGYVTDRIGDGAIEFIRESAGKPFFLFVSFTAPHGPLQPKPEDEAKLGHIENAKRRKYAGLIMSLDDNIGRILKTLDELKLASNTLVIFTNDNGGQTMTGAVNTPLRGRKGQIWEGGTRVPMAFRWPGKIKAGTVIDDPIISLDFLPTFVALGGGDVDPAWKLDGVNLLPRLTGQVDRLATRPLFWRIHGPDRESSVREGDWKLVLLDHAPGTAAQLYHLPNDIGEERDVASEHPEIASRLEQKLRGWEKELISPLWSYKRNRPRGKQSRSRK